MDKKTCAEAFILLNSIFAIKYQEAWVKLFRQDESLSLEWISCFIDEGIDSDVVRLVVSKVKSDDRYSDYPPNLNAFLSMSLSVKFSNLLDDEGAYLSFCTNKNVADDDTDFLIQRTVRAIGSHRLKTNPSLANSFKKLYNKNKSEFISGGLRDEQRLFINKKLETESVKVTEDKRVVETPSLIVSRLKELSNILKK